MTENQFVEKLKEQGIDLDASQQEQFETYLRLLQEWNEKMNLTAITDDEQVWEKHFYDSILPFEKLSFNTLCDVGSGAGFPGIPVAIVWPERKITLVEPLAKRCRFLQAVKEALHLDNVTIINARAEEFAAGHRGEFDVVSARAVARLSILLELCLPLVKDDGIFMAMKGAAAYDELENARPALKALKAKLEKSDEDTLSDGSSRINMIFTKTGPTPKKYPRPYALIKKKPLEEVNG